MLGGNAGGEGRVEIGLAGGFFHNDVFSDQELNQGLINYQGSVDVMKGTVPPRMATWIPTLSAITSGLPVGRVDVKLLREMTPSANECGHETGHGAEASVGILQNITK